MGKKVIGKKFLKQLEIDHKAWEEIRYRSLGNAVLYAITNKASEDVFEEIRKKCIEAKEIFKLKKLIKFQQKDLTEKEAEELLKIYKNDFALEELKNFLKLSKKALKLFRKAKEEQKTAMVVT